MKNFKQIFFFTLITMIKLDSFNCVAKSKSTNKEVKDTSSQIEENDHNKNNQETKSKKEKKNMIIYDHINEIMDNDTELNNNSDVDVLGNSIIEDDGKELVGEEYANWSRIKANMTPKQFKILVQECRYIRKMLLKVINYNKMHPAHEQLKDLLDSETQPLYYKVAIGINNKNKNLSQIIRLDITENIITLGPFKDSDTANNLINIFNSVGVNGCSLLPIQNKKF